MKRILFLLPALLAACGPSDQELAEQTVATYEAAEFDKLGVDPTWTVSEKIVVGMDQGVIKFTRDDHEPKFVHVTPNVYLHLETGKLLGFQTPAKVEPNPEELARKAAAEQEPLSLEELWKKVHWSDQLFVLRKFALKTDADEPERHKYVIQADADTFFHVTEDVFSILRLETTERIRDQVRPIRDRRFLESAPLADMDDLRMHAACRVKDRFAIDGAYGIELRCQNHADVRLRVPKDVHYVAGDGHGTNAVNDLLVAFEGAFRKASRAEQPLRVTRAHLAHMHGTVVELYADLGADRYEVVIEHRNARNRFATDAATYDLLEKGTTLPLQNERSK